jgi:hypothetical protein
MKKPFVQEGPERAIRLVGARASAFRPILPGGTAHSRGEGAGEREHGAHIGAHGLRVNGRSGLSVMMPTALRTSSARVPEIST